MFSGVAPKIEDPALPAALAQRARAGDRDAFQALYLRLGPTVHGVLLARVPAADAEDLVQEVFLAAWTRMAELREPERVAGWLCGIARRRAADLLRAGGPRLETLSDDLAAPDARDAAAVDTAREAAHVLRVIRALPEAYRETLTLRLVEGLDGASIALAVGLTHGSVRVNLTRGMKLLREKLERENES